MSGLASEPFAKSYCCYTKVVSPLTLQLTHLYKRKPLIATSDFCTQKLFTINPVKTFQLQTFGKM